MTLNKKSISWHEENYKNRGIYLQRQKEEIERLQKRLEELQESYDKKERQINTAKKLGLTEFDEESAKFRNL